MNIWFADRPVFLGATGAELPGVITTTPQGTVVVRESDGLHLGIDPTGAYTWTKNNGPDELMTVDASLNVLRYAGRGVSFAVVFRAR